jgi:Putative zinc-finger of transcription factor IIIC complex
VSHEDALMISLFDGSIYLVHNLSSEPFALRIISRSMFPACPPVLVAEAKKLGDIVHASVPLIGTGESLRQSESCPACGTEILLESGAHAVCANGHTWGMILI